MVTAAAMAAAMAMAMAAARVVDVEAVRWPEAMQCDI